MSNYCIVDVETTGANKKGQKITEIAIIKTNGVDVVDQFTTLINPERRIPQKITFLTGITNEMVVNAPKFYEVAKRIIEITSDCIFVAHNVFFDYQFLQREFSELGYLFRRKVYCTVKNSRLTFPGLRSYSLKNLSHHFKIELKNHHRAMSDTKAAFELFKRIQSNNQSPLIQSSTTPSKLEDDKLKHLPETGGLYYFYSESGDLLYIGKSTNIKKRVKSHFRIDTKRRKDIEMKNQIANIDFKELPHDLVARILESQEIKKYRPTYNVSLRRTRYRYEVILVNNNNEITFKHQTSLFSGIPSKSKRHSERIIELLYKTAFGNTGSFELEKIKRIIGKAQFNKRLESIYSHFFYPEENHSFIITGKQFPISFDIEENKLFRIRYQDTVIPIKEDPDIKKILLSHFKAFDKNIL